MSYIYNSNGELISGNVANVVAFGAKGDGVTSDSIAIQTALDSLKTSGGILYFPKGTYLITTSVVFYSNQVLWFEDGATLLQGADINNLMRAYMESTWTAYNGVHDCVIHGGTFDGGAYTTANTLLGIAHAKNIIVENCTFKNGYGHWHDIEINSSCNVKVINCDFEGARRTGQNGEMLQVDGAASSTNYPWDGFNTDGTASKYIDIVGCIFHDCTIAPGIGCHDGTVHNEYIRIHDCIFDGLTSSRGAINFAGATNIDIHDNTFNGCTTGVGSAASTYYVHENRFTSVTTAAASGSVVKANMVNGSFVA